MRSGTLMMSWGVVAGLATSAFGAVSVSQTTAAAPTYGTTLTFDEPGTPTGSVPTNAFNSYGVTAIIAGDGNQYVADFTGVPGHSWLGTGNSFQGHYGIEMQFASDLTAFSAQVWDPSGAPTFFGGGLVVRAYDNGNEVFADVYTPAWGGVGKSWFNITTTGGSVFDTVVIYGNGNFPESHMDNASWNAVPAPGAALALGGLGLAGLRRRRA